MTDWRKQGACSATPDLWFDRSFRVSAVHICRAHCPVIQECNAWVRAGALIVAGVAGGLAHDDQGEALASHGNGKKTARCGPDCRPYRRTAGEGEED